MTKKEDMYSLRELSMTTIKVRLHIPIPRSRTIKIHGGSRAVAVARIPTTRTSGTGSNIGSHAVFDFNDTVGGELSARSASRAPVDGKGILGSRTAINIIL